MKSGKWQVTLWLPQRRAAVLRRAAHARGISVTELIRLAVADHIGRHG